MFISKRVYLFFFFSGAVKYALERLARAAVDLGEPVSQDSNATKKSAYRPRETNPKPNHHL